MSGSVSASSSATWTALSVATAAICFAVGYVNQLLVGAEPFGDDPRPVTGTHTLYTLDELKSMKTDKERVDAYYNKRADLHDVLQATVNEKDVNAAYPKLKDREDLQLLKKAIKQFYPAAAEPLPEPVPEPEPEPEVQIQPIQPAAAHAVPLPPGGQAIQMGGGSAVPDLKTMTNQTISEADGSTGAPHPLFGGGVQPQDYSLGLGHIGVGQ